VLGAPTQGGRQRVFAYMSAPTVRKIMVGYFDTSRCLQRFACYALKDGKAIDEITQTELSGAPSSPLSALFANSNVSGLTSPRELSAPPRQLLVVTSAGDADNAAPSKQTDHGLEPSKSDGSPYNNFVVR
jgi:hypothetical protein